jgi:hypothetical protein
MSQPRRAKRRDCHHQEIRDGLRQLGYYVVDLADRGDGIPDLLVLSKSNIAILVEVKTDDAAFTDDEKQFFLDYRGPLAVATTLESALKTMEYYDGYIMECA